MFYYTCTCIKNLTPRIPSFILFELLKIYIYIYIFLIKLLNLLLQVNKVTTKHQKRPKIDQNSKTTPFNYCQNGQKASASAKDLRRS